MVIVLLVLILVFVVVRLYSIKRSIKKIRLSLDMILHSNTNNLLTLSTKDKDVRGLSDCLNLELKRLRKERLKYENGNNELKRVITNISHDMRTPLTVMSGYIDLIKESDNNRYVQIIDRKTDELIMLTEQLFDFSKFMEIDINFQKKECCINEVLEDVLANYYTIFKVNNIVPDIQICEEKVYRLVDRNVLIRVFDNILSNAIKYSDGDFKLVFDESGKVVFSNKASLLDTVTVKKIFDRYFTVENAKKSTGIGLSIAKQLIELSGGSIEALYRNGELIIEILFD